MQQLWAVSFGAGHSQHVALIGLSTRQGCETAEVELQPQAFVVALPPSPGGVRAASHGSPGCCLQVLCKCWDAQPTALSGSGRARLSCVGCAGSPHCHSPPLETVRDKSFHHPGRELKELLTAGPWRSLGHPLPASAHQAGFPEGIPGCLSPQITVCFCYLLPKYGRADVPPVTVTEMPISSLKH